MQAGITFVGEAGSEVSWGDGWSGWLVSSDWAGIVTSSSTTSAAGKEVCGVADFGMVFRGLGGV